MQKRRPEQSKQTTVFEKHMAIYHAWEKALKYTSTLRVY